MRYLVLSALVMLSFAKPVQAADSSSGCGPGWYVFKDTSLVSSTLRNITHGFLFPTTTLGMTLGTSNCKKHAIVLHNRRTEQLVASAFDEVLNDIVRGQGEYLQALAVTLDCPWQSQAEFNAELRSSYDTLMPNAQTTQQEFLRNLQEKILLTPQLASQCGLGLS